METISIDIATLNIPALLPMAILALGALALICVDLAVKGLNRSFLTMITILFILLDLGAVLGYHGPVRGFFDVLLVDGIALIAQVIILVASAIFLPLSLSHRHFREFEMAEFYEREVDHALKRFISVLEPALMLFVGIAVGAMVVTIIAPIYSIVGNLQDTIAR